MKSSNYIGQKFNVGDRVKEAPAFGMDQDGYKRREGVVTDFFTKKNRLGREQFYYEVLWDGHQRSTQRVQHRLTQEGVA